MSFLAQIIENQSTAVIVCDSELLVESVNVAFEDMFAASRRRIIGKQLQEVVFADNKIALIVQRALKNQSRYSLRGIELVRPEGVEVDVTITPFVSANIDKIVLELNRMDRLNRLIRESNSVELQATNRLIMRSLSHEIKNPLSGIRGAAQLLESELDNVELKEFTEVIIRESDRLTNLVNRVMGSHKSYAMEDTNIHMVTEHVARLLLSGEDSLEVMRDYDPSLPEFLGDAEQLIQAVLNIANNAAQAQCENTKAVVGFRTRLERGFTINKFLHRQVIKLQIWDEGSGVPAEIKEIVFNPMITGRAEGTGLGLSISQEIAQRHEGLIMLEEYQGKTCFSIYLPLYRDALDKNIT